MGVGKLAITVLLLGLLAFGTVTAFSMAEHNKPTTTIGNGTSEMVATVGVVGGAGANLMPPLVIISGIMLLLGAFVMLRKSSHN
jgi:hypothetical protein